MHTYLPLAVLQYSAAQLLKYKLALVQDYTKWQEVQSILCGCVLSCSCSYREHLRTTQLPNADFHII